MTTLASVHPQPPQPGQIEGVAQEGQAPVPDLQDRFIEQNRRADVWLRHPDRAEARESHGRRKRAVPTLWTDKSTGTTGVYGHGDGPNILPSQVEGFDRWQNPALWTGKHTGHLYPEAIQAARDLASGDVTPQQLFRSYKSTPHQPAAVFLKYIVHRVNHADQYDDPATAHKLDHEFLDLAQVGRAEERNGHLAIEDLHRWLNLNHRVVPQVLAHRDAVQQDILKGVGMNVRTIMGEPHVALTRGLHSDIMTKEHPLSSWADVPDSGFGDHMHHAWVPLKDIWFGFPHFHSDYSEGNHENEFLVSHTQPKYAAEPHDVKESRLKDWKWYRPPSVLHPQHTDDMDMAWRARTFYDLAHRASLIHPWTDAAQDGDIAQHLKGVGLRTELPLQYFFHHKNAGPATQAEAQRIRAARGAGPNSSEGAVWQSFASTPRQEALGTIQDQRLWQGGARSPLNALENPNLTHEDLNNVLHALPSQTAGGYVLDRVRDRPHPADEYHDERRYEATQRILSHPNADSATAEYYWNAMKAQPRPDAALGAVAESHLTPASVLDEMIDRGVELPAWNDLLLSIAQNPNLTEKQADKMADHMEPRGRIGQLARFAPLGKAAVERLVKATKEGRKGDHSFIAQQHLEMYIEENPRATEDGLLAALDAVAPQHGEGWGKLSDFGNGLDLMDNRADKYPLPPAVQLEYVKRLDQAYRRGQEARELGDPPARYDQYLIALAQKPWLAPHTIAVLASHPDSNVRASIYRNPAITPEMLEASFPMGEAGQQARKNVEEMFKPSDPLEEWWRTVLDRKSYAERKAREHLIRPLPNGLWKDEEDAEHVMFRATIADWLSKLVTHDPGYLLAMDTEPAHMAIRSNVIDPDWTEELLEGQAVIAHPAKPHHYVALQNALPPGKVIVHFHADDKPTQMSGGRVWWPGPLKLRDGRVLAIGMEKSEGLEKMAVLNPRENPSFNKWFEGSKVVDDAGAPKRVLHGTTHSFETFGNRKGNPENWYGRAHYFTDSPEDAGKNYAAVGPDLKQRIEQRAERMNGGWDNTGSYDARRQEAERQLVGPAPQVIPAYLRMKNPLRLDEDFVDDRRLIRAIHRVAPQYGYDPRSIVQHLGVHANVGMSEADAASASDVDSALRSWEGGYDNVDDEGNIQHNEFIRDIWQAMGHDGIIMDASRFNMPGTNGATHYVVFKPTQVKSVFNRTFSRRNGHFGKGEEPLDLGANLLPQKLDDGEHDVALRMLGHDPEANRALAAARFLTGAKREPDMDRFRLAHRVFGDVERAALYAYQIPDSQKNLRALRATVKLGGKDLAKAEEAEGPEPHETITSVEPGVTEAKETAVEVMRGVQAGLVTSLHLNGKHSKGAMAVKDPRTLYVRLLKPGSGSQSPAAGSRQEKASQSRREAGFWHVADLWDMGGFYPHTDLIIVNDGEEWAAIKLLGPEFKPLDEKNRAKERYGAEVLQPYLEKGLLHRFAILDWVCGNPDSHGQNILVNRGGSVSLIDHGSAFAGSEFDPAHDKNSFIPFYLRVWGPLDFMKLSPEERVRHMPRLSDDQDAELREWLESVEPAKLEVMLGHYGLDPKPVLTRLQVLRDVQGNLSDAVNRLWAGA